MHFNTLVVAALFVIGTEGRAREVSTCDYYTTLQFKENTAANQLKLLTLLVNTALGGNFGKYPFKILQ